MEREEIERIMRDKDTLKYDSVIEHVFNLEKQVREVYKDNTRLFAENISLRCCDNCKHSVSMSEIGINYIRPCFNCDNKNKWELEV